MNFKNMPMITLSIFIRVINSYSCTSDCSGKVYSVDVNKNMGQITPKLTDSEQNKLIDETHKKILGTWQGSITNDSTESKKEITFIFSKDKNLEYYVMDTYTKDILEKALKLKSEERAYIAEHLISSLDDNMDPGAELHGNALAEGNTKKSIRNR